MVPSRFPHKQYVRWVRNKASRCGGLRTAHRHFQVWRKLEAADLDAVYPTLAALYSADQGRIARHPVCMFRSCLAMMLCDVTSFDVWVPMMRDDPFYALISGFPRTTFPASAPSTTSKTVCCNAHASPAPPNIGPIDAVTGETRATSTRIRMTYGLTRASSTAWRIVSRLAPANPHPWRPSWRVTVTSPPFPVGTGPPVSLLRLLCRPLRRPEAHRPGRPPHRG